MCHCRALFSVTVSTGVANMGTTNYANRIGNGNLPFIAAHDRPLVRYGCLRGASAIHDRQRGPRHSVRPPNFGAPNGTLNNPQVGAITSAADPRRVQMGAKLVF